MLAAVIQIFLIVNSINSCFSNDDRFRDRSRFLTKFPGSHKIGNVSLISTIGSGTFKKNVHQSRSQTLNIKQQLMHGVRVLNLGLGAVSNRLALYTGPTYLGQYLENVLSQVDDFLLKFPREFVFILIYEDYMRADDVTLTNCEILQNYVKKWDRIVTEWNLNMTFRKVWGKILLATQTFGSGFDDCIVNLRKKCLVQDKKCNKMKSVDEIDNKWENILRLEVATFYDKHQCFVNNLHCYRSKHKIEVIANHGYLDSFGECVEPINKRMTKHFHNPHRGLIIIVASFVSQKLIDKVIFSNFEPLDNNNFLSVINV